MAKSSSHVWQRGRQYYLKLAIPRKVRHNFPSSTGKPRSKIVEPLADSYEVAKVKAAQRVAQYLEVFARLKAGEQLTPEQIQAELAVDAARIRREAYEYTIASFERTRRWAQARPKSAAVEAEYLGAQDALSELGVISSPESAKGETINQAAEAWLAERQRDDDPSRPQTVEGHRQRVQAFIAQCGDIPLASVTRAMASDFLTKIAAGPPRRANRTVNKYATTLASVFKSARQRGRVTGDNPFEDQRRKAGDNHYSPFQDAEIKTLFDALPLDLAPVKHTPEAALPWAVRIAAFSGARLEEIAQLTVADIKDVQANGAVITCFDIHNGDDGHKLKNESSVRVIPIHSKLVRMGLIDYAKALPQDGPLFPGLTRRASKGNKIGARLGELFRKKLEALGLKRERLCFHSFRHTVGDRLRKAGVPQDDRAALLGHAEDGISSRVYGHDGPGLKRLAAVVEEIAYPGLNIRKAS